MQKLQHVSFAVLLLLLCSAAWVTGVVPTRRAAFDVLHFVDAGWRALAGQRPHVDFFCPFGAGMYLVYGAQQWLGGGTVEGIGRFSALTGLFVGAWTYLLMRQTKLIAFTAGLLLALLCIAPVSLGLSFGWTSHAMFYNRYFFALTGLVIIECFPLEPKHGSLWGGISTGVACALLLFLKASYFLVAVGLFVLSLLWRSVTWTRLLGAAVGFAVACIPFLAYIRFDVGAMLADLRFTAVVRGGAIPIGQMLELFTKSITELFVLAGLGWALGIDSADRNWLWRARYALLAVVVYCSGVLLMTTNTQTAGMPLDELLGLLFAARFIQLKSLDPPIASIMACIALAVTLPYATSDAAAMFNGLRLKYGYDHTKALSVDIGGLKPWVLLEDYADPTDPYSSGAPLVPHLTDGVAILRQHLKPGETVAALETYNPFPYLLQIPPPRGGMAASTYPLLLNEEHHLPPDEYFGTADVVMLPKYPLPRGNDGLVRIYGAALEERFQLAAESDRWKIYRRKNIPHTLAK